MNKNLAIPETSQTKRNQYRSSLFYDDGKFYIRVVF